jgi:bifunctional non-homologous end joining protein LigD
MPALIEPMLPTLVRKPFSQSGWIYEPKWDGWRTIVFLCDGKAHLASRKRNSLDERFPVLRDIGKLIKAKTAITDGEVVAIDQDGLPRFDALRFKRERKCSLVFYAFDLLYLDGFDLTACPLSKRKALLKRILPKDNTGRIRFTDHIEAKGEGCLRSLKHCNLEGMVMKRKDPVYVSTRCRDCLKVREPLPDV